MPLSFDLVTINYQPLKGFGVCVLGVVNQQRLVDRVKKTLKTTGKNTYFFEVNPKPQTQNPNQNFAVLAECY
jgi:lipid II:glycine glycyltransferase (peptidoglycan interpeptide bridge formation enzyme)